MIMVRRARVAFGVLGRALEGALPVAAAALLWLVGAQPTAHAQTCPEETGEVPCVLVDGAVVRGYLRGQGAANVYRFDVPAPAASALVVLSELPADYNLYLTDEAGQVVAESTNDGVNPEVIHPDLPAPGSYYVHVVVDPARPFEVSGFLPAGEGDIRSPESREYGALLRPPSGRVLRRAQHRRSPRRQR